MAHITLSKKSTSKPSLEFYSDDSGEARRVTIEHSPYRIGRAETADLRVESVDISREHAEIVERNGMWLLRDLDSTNGTLVNGRPIKEAPLADGDIVKIAETELTFIASVASQFRRMLTQPTQAKKEVVAPNSLPPELVATRIVTEATLWQTIVIHLFAATSLRQCAIEAFFAPASTSANEQPLLDQPHPVGERYRELEQMRALELASERAESSRLFLGVRAVEIESPHRLFSSLEKLQGLLPVGWELGITISLPADVDALGISEIHREARKQALLVAFDEFQGNGEQVMHLESLLPDYLVLADTMTRDLANARQPLRGLESLLATCGELEIKPVLPRVECGHTLALCQEMGFDLVLQSAIYRSVMPVEELSLSV